MKKLIFLLAFLCAFAAQAWATPVSVAAHQLPNFNATSIGSDVPLTVSVTNNSPTVTCSSCFKPQWIGLHGFTVRIVGVDYTVQSVDSASSLTLTANYAASTNPTASAIWRKYIEVRIYASLSFAPLGNCAATGAPCQIQSGTPGSGSWYKRFAASVVNVGGINSLFLPELSGTRALDATTDAPTNNTATYTVGFYRASTSTTTGSLIQYYSCGGVRQLALPPNTPTNWTDICTFNSSVLIVQDNRSFTISQINAIHPSCSVNQLIYYATTGQAQTCLTLGSTLNISAGVLSANVPLLSCSAGQMIYYATTGTTQSCLTVGSGLNISAGTITASAATPNCSTGQMVFYAANGTTQSCLTVGSGLNISAGTITASAATPNCSTGQMVFYAANGTTQSCLTVGSGLNISAGTITSSSGIPSCSINNLVYYASAGTTLSCLTVGSGLNISGGTITNTFGPGGSDGNLQYRVNSTTFGGVAGSSVTTLGEVTLNNTARTSGSAPAYRIRTSADTTLAADTEATFGFFGGDGSAASVTRQWTQAGGTFTNQREWRFIAPTYAATAASETITGRAATLSISGPPAAGTNMALSNPRALWIEAGQSEIPNGSSSAASITWSASNDSGIFSENGHVTSFTAQGNYVAGFNGASTPALIFTSGANLAWSNSTSSITGTTDVGIVRHAAGVLRINDGVGTTTPGQLLIGNSGDTATAQLDIRAQASQVGINIDTTASDSFAPILALFSTAATNGPISGFTLSMRSTGTPAAGLGPAIVFQLESNTTNERFAGFISPVWSNASDASRTSDFRFDLSDNAVSVTAFKIRGEGYFGSSQSHKALASAVTITSNTTLTALSGATVNVVSGRTYEFIARVYVTPGNGGFKVSIGGTAGAPAFGSGYISRFMQFLDASGTLQGTGDCTFGGACSSQAGPTTRQFVEIAGTITPSSSGTLAVLAAQNSSDAAATTVHRGTSFKVREIY